MADPYVDPETGVFYNRLGISDADELAAVEADTTTWRITELSQRPPLGNTFDLAHLCTIHRHIFRDLHAWAGEIRTVTIAKSTSIFCLPAHIERYADQVFGQLAAEEHLRGLDREAFIERLAYYWGELNAMHPFREGNGRTQRAFLVDVARNANYALDWTGLDADANDRASIEAFHTDLSGLRRLLDHHVLAHPPTSLVAADQPAQPGHSKGIELPALLEGAARRDEGLDGRGDAVDFEL